MKKINQSLQPTKKKIKEVITTGTINLGNMLGKASSIKPKKKKGKEG